MLLSKQLENIYYLLTILYSFYYKSTMTAGEAFV